MNPYDTYTEAQRIRDLIDWHESDGVDTLLPTGIDVREAVTDQEREEFRLAWEALQR